MAYTDSKTAGSAVVLLHGWPEDHGEWRRLVLLLSSQYRVITIDLPGIGQSQPWTGGYSKGQTADALHELLGKLGIDQAAIGGHDIGGMVAHAYARKFPQATSKLFIIDVPLPGVEPWEQIKSDPRAWHFGFHQEPIAETLVAGHQRAYFKSFYGRLSVNKGVFDDAQINAYARSYQSAAQLTSGFEYYRAFGKDETDMTTLSATPLNMPILYIGGSGSMGPFLAYAVQGMQKLGATQIESLQIDGSGHWVAEEQPGTLAKGLLNFLGK